MPTPEQCVEPLLRFLQSRHPDGATKQEVTQALANHFELSDGERKNQIPSGQIVYEYRIATAHTYLKRAGLSSMVRRGQWAITARGMEFLSRHPRPIPPSEVSAILNSRAQAAPVEATSPDVVMDEPLPRNKRWEPKSSFGQEAHARAIALLHELVKRAPTTRKFLETYEARGFFDSGELVEVVAALHNENIFEFETQDFEYRHTINTLLALDDEDLESIHDTLSPSDLRLLANHGATLPDWMLLESGLDEPPYAIGDEAEPAVDDPAEESGAQPQPAHERLEELEHIRAETETEEDEPAADGAEGVAKDERKRVLRQITARQGQGEFRKGLLRAYEGRCAATGCDVEAAVEAAHIARYSGPGSNGLDNGLLLRADIHTLFDLGLLAVDTSNMTVLLAESLAGTVYASELAGRRLRLPKDRSDWPSRRRLDEHRRDAGL